MRWLLAFALLGSSQAVGETRGFTLVTMSGPIGTLTINQSGKTIESKWRVDDNGRGAKIDEKIELGPDGLPVRWELSGKSNAGAPVKEQFAVEGGRGKWSSLDGSGEGDAKGAFYVPNDGTPLFAELLLKTT